MLDNIIYMLPEIWVSTKQTLTMTGIALLVAIFAGIPLGTLLFLTRKGQLLQNKAVFTLFNGLVNIVNSVPLLILFILLIPVTRIIVGTSVGTIAAAVPLSFATVPYLARLIEQTLLEVDKGTIEASLSMGSNIYQIVWKVLYREALPGITNSITIVLVGFISYSTIAGLVGGGGMGDFAIRYGYYRYQTDIMLFTVLIMVLLVQFFQILGSRLARYLDKR